MNSTKHPLCVDLDGTLLRTDTLYESLVLLIRKQWLKIFLLPVWLYKGRAFLKEQVHHYASPLPALLPIHDPFLQYLQKQHASGRKLILVTASNEQVAKEIAKHVGLFSDVIASNGQENIKGARKAAVLTERFGKGQFAYAGNSIADIPVWQEAGESIVVQPSWLLRLRMHVIPRMSRAFPPPSVQSTLEHVLRLIRVHQWSKNVLIFAPAIFAHTFINPTVLHQAIVAFISFSCLSSVGYIINDLLDIEHDRAHASKKKRPLASGDISIPFALFILIITLAITCFFASLLPMSFGLLLLGYFIITNLYSFKFRSIPVVDVFTVASLYTVRIYAGSLATSIPVSSWLLGLSLFLFLSIAYAKRYIELCQPSDAKEKKTNGRGYITDDAEQIARFGTTSGYASVVILLLYINSEKASTLYTNNGLLWALFPLMLFWLTRFWLHVSRGSVHEDPVVYVLRDWVTYAIGVGILGILLLASIL